MYSSILSGYAAVERVWVGDSIIDPTIGHRSDPVLGPDLVFTVLGGSCEVAFQGPVTRRIVYPFQPEAHYIGVRFRPGIGSITDGVELAGIRNGKIPIEQLNGFPLEPLCEKLLETPDLIGQGRLVNEALHRLAVSGHPPSPLVEAVLDRFRTEPPGVRIGRLAADVGVTERTLQRHFRTQLGISPKQAARLVRIERLTAQLYRSEPSADCSLAIQAATAGYFDQAHMTNEVTRVLGITPRTLLDERLAHLDTSSKEDATPVRCSAKPVK